MTTKTPKTAIPMLPFTDAQEMQRQYPDTFSAPTVDEIRGLNKKACVKVCAGNERFWVLITQISPNEQDPFMTDIHARIDNDLVFTEEHGLKCDDIISFEGRHIYAT